MTKTFRNIIIAALVLIALAGIAVALVLSAGNSTTATDPLATAKTTALNAALDASGVKGKLESELHDHSGEIAEQVGIPQSVVDNAIDSLDIEEWQVTTLPETATETGTYAVNAGETNVQITSYDDPSLATVEAYGQTLTLEVPESAQPYLTMLGYLS